ncbi:DNA polymerase Y family protein [Paractinoplanes lichenicola]|uniref:DNA polymerase Y family protein n=1 Tax=Paractinoplanes lichenicola TaxID=2802976 RepID=A0ABS1VPA3_9ACTN|nr:DNA polymerase Y family protein [Actinoplanes lichenicola]MBL7256555.1 DNA polymerase Y family protein [Actinoplanes lichenicola]
MLLWCPDWPVMAAEIVLGVSAAKPVIVLHGNRVIACSEAARREGVRRGLRRREAQSRCPQVEAVEHDPGRDARAFEPVVAAVEEVAAGVEVIRPGACAVAARGPSRYFGGEEAAAERLVEQVAESCEVESQVGIAEGVFAAGLAARAGRVIEPGETAAFLRAQPIEAIERPELTDLLKRLGLKTLGEFAALPAGDVLTRFGFDGALAHRLAAGFDHRPLAVRRPPPDLEVSETYDEPLERVDVAAFAGRALAERLHDKLAAYGLACTRLGIEAVTANGQELHRVWRHDGTLTSAAIAERVRWQLDGWLTGARRGAPARPTAGLVRLRLIPDGVLVHLGLQPGLWGDAGADRERAHRAFSRVQGLLGPESVVTPVLGGGRNADDQIRLVPWGDERAPHRPAAPHTDPIPGIKTVPVLSHHIQPELALPSPETPFPVRDEPGPAVDARPRRPVLGLVTGGQPTRERDPMGEMSECAPGEGKADKEAGVDAAQERVNAGKGRKKQQKEPPWPGKLPKPAPAIVPVRALPAVVLDDQGDPVGVSARLELTGSPAALIIERARPVPITGWAGPWPVDERWWDANESRRRARFQVVLEDGRAFLLGLSGGHWAIEAIYD